ncbi:MAG TPA: ATP-binding protein, partial [Vicinamibacterales bacterium]|nr:ATP-binding protein [Vicinamibacterales bacterium]
FNRNEQGSAAARAVGQGLALTLARAERDASDNRDSGLVRLARVDGGLVARPGRSLLWVPRAPLLLPVEHPDLTSAERLESQGDTVAAFDRYLALSASPTPAVRAGALFGLARLERRALGWDAALSRYESLATLTGVGIAGAPVDLQARRARCAVLEAAGRRDALHREAAQLEADWLEGRWALDHASWTLVADDLARWTGRQAVTDPLRAVFSEAATRYWTDDTAGRSTSSSRVIDINGTSIVMWHGADGDVLATTEARLRSWVDEAVAVAGVAANAIRIDLEDQNGREGADLAGAFVAEPHVTGLPWAVSLSHMETPRTSWMTGEAMVYASLVVLVIFVAAGGYSVVRLVRREMAVGRLQSDFVAAVSHEFRTPLTTIRHVIELLGESDELPPDRRQEFYRAVGRNAERLQRLVESLLDFSRMESGRTPYTLARIDAAELARAVVSDFTNDIQSRGRAPCVTVDAPTSAPVDADAPSLGLAIWNLLDNAVKYAPEESDVTVTVREDGSRVTLAVRDHGYGIPTAEQREIFGRFARGEAARRRGIKGTGIGLAIVAHVAHGHGGQVEVTSVEGQGSEFRIVLPRAATEIDAPATVALAGDQREPWRAS